MYYDIKFHQLNAKNSSSSGMKMYPYENAYLQKFEDFSAF